MINRKKMIEYLKKVKENEGSDLDRSYLAGQISLCEDLIWMIKAKDFDYKKEKRNDFCKKELEIEKNKELK